MNIDAERLEKVVRIWNQMIMDEFGGDPHFLLVVPELVDSYDYK